MHQHVTMISKALPLEFDGRLPASLSCATTSRPLARAAFEGPSSTSSSSDRRACACPLCPVQVSRLHFPAACFPHSKSLKCTESLVQHPIGQTISVMGCVRFQKIQGSMQQIQKLCVYSIVCCCSKLLRLCQLR